MPVTAPACPNCGAPLTLVGTRCKFCQVHLEVTGPDGSPATAPDPGPPPVAAGAFSLQVEDVFTIAKRGTVATGRVATGSIRVGDHLRIEGASGSRAATCAGVEQFRKKTTEAHAGDNVGLLLDGPEKGDVVAGDWILSA